MQSHDAIKNRIKRITAKPRDQFGRAPGRTNCHCRSLERGKTSILASWLSCSAYPEQFGRSSILSAHRQHLCGVGVTAQQSGQDTFSGPQPIGPPGLHNPFPISPLLRLVLRCTKARAVAHTPTPCLLSPSPSADSTFVILPRYSWLLQQFLCPRVSRHSRGSHVVKAGMFLAGCITLRYTQGSADWLGRKSRLGSQPLLATTTMSSTMHSPSSTRLAIPARFSSIWVSFMLRWANMNEL